MKGEVIGQCPVCKGTGIIRRAIEYPGFEDQRCCPHCKTGLALAEAIAKVIARTANEERAKVA